MPMNYVSSCEKLVKLCTNLFVKHGLTEEDAQIVSRSLVSADMRGVRSHGLVRVELYLNQIKSGVMDPRAEVSVIKETETTALLDGNHGLGAVISERAVAMTRKKANAFSTGFVTVRRSNHFGAAGYWAIEIAGNDMIGFATTNAQPVLAAPNGKNVLIGNNPFSIAVPAGKYSTMCLDISCGVMAMGKIFEHRRLNKPFPEGSWLDKNGNPTTDPYVNNVTEFIGLPFGMHKGFGIAVMVEAITSILAGGLVAAEVPDAYDLNKKNAVTHSFFAMRIDAFRELSEYIAKIEEFIDYLHAAPTCDGTDHIFYPNEIEINNYNKALKEGIVIPSDIKDYLVHAASEIGLEVDSSIFTPVIN